MELDLYHELEESRFFESGDSISNGIIGATVLKNTGTLASSSHRYLRVRPINETTHD
jgi:hypothetical protein